MRPVYESERDRTEEDAIATILSARWGVTATKLTMKHEIDYDLACGGHTVGLLEAKRRYNPVAQYWSVYLSAMKYLTAQRWLELGIPTAFGVQYDDVLLWYPLWEQPDMVALGGRNDRGDPQDIELVVHFSTKRGRRVEEMGDGAHGFLGWRDTGRGRGVDPMDGVPVVDPERVRGRSAAPASQAGHRPAATEPPPWTLT